LANPGWENIINPFFFLFAKASIRTLKRVNDKNDQQQTLINLESFSKIQIKYLELKNVPRHSNFIPDGYTVELTPKRRKYSRMR